MPANHAERRVLLLYQPVYHPHLAIEPSTTVSTASSTSASRSAANSRNVSPRQSPCLNGSAAGQQASSGKKSLTFQLGEPALSPPAASTAEAQQQHGMLHTGKSRSVPALQEAGKHVVEHLEERMAKGKAPSKDDASSSGVTIDIFSILPASYTRSTHPAFNHSASSMHSGSHSAHRTVSGSSSEGSGDSASRRHSHHHHHQSRGHAALAGLAHLLHRYSPSSSAPNSRAPSRRGSVHSHHSQHSSSRAHAHAASDALLQLTDVLRVEDEEAEEAREQLLDRLAILAGELDDGGVQRRVNVDVRQAADGESLLEALHSLVKERGEGGYDELIVVNDSEWEEEEGPVTEVVAMSNCTSTYSSNSSPASTSGRNTPAAAAPSHSSRAASASIPKKRKRLTFNLSKLHFPHHKAPLSWEEREKEQEQGRVVIAPLEIVRKDLHHDAETRKVEVIAM